ncbi:DUF1883 domain-containing protein [Mesorhizobium sp. M0830]|uniref:DUF1883 domain-containing protein n=1 Tax=Mesorhizobium sp. M0830 TaxID=2957008 RepID=UPI00333D6F14
MNFTHCDLGQCSRGQRAEITFTSGANLRLLDLTSCSNYGRGERPQYGRLAKQTVLLQVPKSVHWHVAVNMQGLEGSTCFSIRKLPGPLPELREALCSVPSAAGKIHRRESPVRGVHLPCFRKIRMMSSVHWR